VAVLEQIRTLRDRKRWADAVSFVEQTQRWAEKARPNDIQAALDDLLSLLAYYCRGELYSGIIGPHSPSFSI
jgi:hypothetical protein